MNAALVLLADHELATSTMAVRVAASVRADPYDAFLAGLATLAGPAARWRQPAGLRAPGRGRAGRRGRARSNDVLRERGRLPGFGHTVYKSGDPRFGALLTLAEPLLSEERRAILARGHGAGGGPRRAAGQLRPRPRRAELGHRHAARHRPHALRRGPRRRVGRPLHGGADRAARCASGPGPSTASDAG